VVEGLIHDMQENGYDGVLMKPAVRVVVRAKAAYAMARRGVVYGIALLDREQDRKLAEWLNDHDAETEATDRDAFRDTTTAASRFYLRVGRTYYDDLVESLRPHRRVSESDVRRLTAISRDLLQLAATRCNEPEMTDEQHDQHLTELRGQAEDILRPERIEIELAGDPRAGYGMRLMLPSGRTNDFAESGMIVPTALSEYAGRWGTKRRSHTGKRSHEGSDAEPAFGECVA
jgi:hypothetical protein